MTDLLSPAQTPTPPTPPSPPTNLPPGQTIGGVATPPVVDVAALQAQFADLTVQLSALRAQSRGLETQLNRMRLDNPARPAVQQQAAEVGVKMAQIEGELARVQAQIAQKQGVLVQGTTAQPPVLPRSRQWDPDYTAGLMFAFIFAVLMPMSIGWARRIWKGKPVPARPPVDDASAQRLERLEHAIDAIAIEVERISEGQRFVTKVLADRPMQPAANAKPDAPAAEPLRALGAGAGPMEPIRMAEKQAVRPSITPH